MIVRCVAVCFAALMVLSANPAWADDGDEDDSIAYTERALWIPMTDGLGQQHRLAGKLCLPQDGEGGLARLIVINHGSPASPDGRPAMTPGKCDSEVAQWFLGRGFAVLYALRRGYGATGGAWVENFGSCDNADFAKAGLESARDVGAMVEFATRQPGVRPDGVIVAGVSAGAWATVAYDSVRHPKVIGMIAMAPGRGGHQGDEQDGNCRPDRLAQAAALFGKTSTTPMIWIYAQNDTFFAPALARSMYQAFTRAGGRIEFHALGPDGDEGHYLWSSDGGSETWGPLVENYLRRLGALDQYDGRD
jgi:pimeloyl-ACP methyl ester carboxylesterase